MIGRAISHYKILDKLGEGGMGVVYKAEDTKLKRTVALKFLLFELTRDEKAKKRFIREAQAASSLDHNNICTIYEIDESENGQLFIAMAYYEGETLKDKIAHGPLELEEAIKIAGQVTEGLSKAHQRDIVHRDIKPANIIVTTDGVVKIVDFGLAKLAGQPHLTTASMIMGTANYMSPEQVQGSKVDHPADIWSLGVVLYEMVTGRVPFRGDYEQGLVYSILNENPEPITEANSSIPLEFEKIVNRCLLKDAKERYQNAADLQADLKHVKRNMSSEKTAVHNATTAAWYPFPQLLRKIAAPLGGVILILLLLLSLPSARQTVKKWLGFEAIPAEKHLAVLPFTNVGGDPSNQAFCDGLVETLTSKLTQLEQFQGSLWVVPASEVRRQRIESPSEARRAFGVNLVVSGSVQRIGDRFHLTLNLVDAKTVRQLNSSVISHQMTNISVLQHETVIKMAEMLNLELHTQTRRLLTAGGTSVPGAYEFYLQGRGYLQRFEKVENLDTAIDLFNRAIEQDSVYALAYAGLGEAHWRKYEASKDVQWVKHAISYCDRALKLSDPMSPVHVTLGLIHHGTGHSEEALQDFQQALELDPANTDAYREMARAYEALGKLEQAEMTYEKAIQLRPSYWANYNVLGVFYYRQGRYEDASKQFQRVVALTPDNTRGYNNLGACFFLLQRWGEARQTFERSLAIKSSYSAYSNLATLYFYEARYADAAQLYETALKISDNDYTVWGNLAASYYWTPDERDKAQAKYQKAAYLAEQRLEVNPLDPDVLSNLAGYYGRMGNRSKTLSLLKQLLALKPSNLEVIFRIADIYEQLGERELALKWIATALEKGYSLAEIDHYPGMRELRADSHFKLLLKNSKKEP